MAEELSLKPMTELLGLAFSVALTICISVSGAGSPSSTSCAPKNQCRLQRAPGVDQGGLQAVPCADRVLIVAACLGRSMTCCCAARMQVSMLQRRQLCNMCGSVCALHD